MPKTPIVKKSSSIFPYRGKWRIQYLDLQGKVRTKTAATKEDAYKQLGTLEHLKASGELPRRSQDLPSVSEWLDYWLEVRKSELREVSWQGFEASARLHLKPVIGKLPLDRLTSSILEETYKGLGRDKKLSPATIHRMHAMVRHSYSMAERHGVIDKNPTARVRLPEKPKPTIQVLSRIEYQKLWREIEALTPIQQLRWSLALKLGLRQGECLALTPEDFNLESGTVSISKTLNRLPQVGFVVTAPKSASSKREIPLDSGTSTLASQVIGQAKSGPGEFLFHTESGHPLDAKTDYMSWIKLLQVAGLPRRKLHVARHTAASLMVGLGVGIKNVQEILGHSTPGFTLATYVHTDKEQLRGALEALSNHIDSYKN